MRADSSWAKRMKHSFGLDVRQCPRCPGQLRFIAVLYDRREVRRGRVIGRHEAPPGRGERPARYAHTLGGPSRTLDARGSTRTTAVAPAALERGDRPEARGFDRAPRDQPPAFTSRGVDFRDERCDR